MARSTSGLAAETSALGLFPNARRDELGETEAWAIVRALAAAASAGRPLVRAQAVSVGATGRLRQSHRDARVLLRPDSEPGWQRLSPVTSAAARLFDVFVPVCVGRHAAQLSIAHLGQSIDGRVATVTGASRYITGDEDLRHTHRLRALADAVVVGAQTVEADDPRLTTRLVEGRTPTRVVLDPRGRLDASHRVFADAAAPTLRVVAHDARPPESSHARVLRLAADRDGFPVPMLITALRELGLKRLFIEGGGNTVSRFMTARALDRLHLAVAPRILGSGTPALSLPEVAELSDATPLRCRTYALDRDILFDCDLRPG